MARWDEILTLPVQNPTTAEFSAADITWSMVVGWKDSMDRLALIPFSRVNDFVRGESNNKECQTQFHVEAHRERPPTMKCKPKVDGILEYILYWCSFGPDDYRQGGKRKTPSGRPNTKRGCVCHFIVKRLIAEPSVALVIYNHNKHVDKKGSPCHGPMDKMQASDGDEGTAEMQTSDGDEGTAEMQAYDGDEGTAEMQASDGDEGTAEKPASDGDEETAATPIMILSQMRLDQLIG